MLAVRNSRYSFLTAAFSASRPRSRSMDAARSCCSRTSSFAAPLSAAPLAVSSCRSLASCSAFFSHCSALASAALTWPACSVFVICSKRALCFACSERCTCSA